MRFALLIAAVMATFATLAQSTICSYAKYESENEAYLQFSGLQKFPALQELSQVNLAYRFLDNKDYSSYATAYLANHYEGVYPDSAAYFIRRHITNCNSKNDLSSTVRSRYGVLITELEKQVQCEANMNDSLVEEIYRLREADQYVRRHFANARRGTPYFDSLLVEEKNRTPLILFSSMLSSESMEFL